MRREAHTNVAHWRTGDVHKRRECSAEARAERCVCCQQAALARCSRRDGCERAALFVARARSGSPPSGLTEARDAQDAAHRRLLPQAIGSRRVVRADPLAFYVVFVSLVLLELEASVLKVS